MRHRDTLMAGPHPRPARRADHVRLEGGVLGRRGPAAPRPAARGRAALAGRPARRRRSAPWASTAPRGARRCAPVLRRAGAGRPRHLVADRPRPDRRVRRACSPWCAARWRGSATRSTSCSARRSASCASRRSRGTVGSITMPHKRNPEGSEHLDTLARLVRANAGVLLEGMVGGHERDGRGWKAEWVALPGGLPAHRHRAAAGPAPARAGWWSTSTAMRANLDPSRRRLGVGAGPRRAEPAAGQARSRSSCCTTSSRRAACRRCRSRRPLRARARPARRGAARGWPGRGRAPPARWSMPSWPGRAPPARPSPGPGDEPAGVELARLPTPLLRARGLERGPTPDRCASSATT